MEKILILGIGPSQVDLIKKCKELGMTIYAVAHNEFGPGRELVDEFRKIDIKDHVAVEEYAREKEVDYVFTVASEVGVMTTAVVSENLNLPHLISSESAKILTKKTIFRNHLGDIKGNVKFISGKNLEELSHWNDFPAIIKPVDGSGQRGVHKLEKHEDIAKYFDESMKYSNSSEVMIEEFIKGDEISVNSFMENGQLKYAIISDRISYSEYPGGIIKEHHVPSKVAKGIENDVLELVEYVNKKTGFNNGHIYFQLKVHDGEAKLIEYTPRHDGCHMWRLINESRGIDLLDASLQLLMEGKTNGNFEESNQDKYVLKFLSEKPGVKLDKNKFTFDKDPIYLEWYLEDGQEVPTSTGYIEKAGYYIYKA